MMNNFSFFHNVFFSSSLVLSTDICFQICLVQIYCVWERGLKNVRSNDSCVSGSLLSSSAVPDLLPSGQPRKRKTQSAASVRPAEGKKIKESDREHQLSLRSSLLLSGNAQSSLLLTTHGRFCLSSLRK